MAAVPVMFAPCREEIKMFPHVQSYITEVNVLVFTALYQAKFRYLLSPGMNFHPCPNWTHGAGECYCRGAPALMW